MADKSAGGVPEVDTNPKQDDPQSDKNFDYEQPVDQQDGVPMKDWIVEQPFDSADYLDKEMPVYAGDATRKQGGDQPTPAG
jgi:hypothetical protein